MMFFVHSNVIEHIYRPNELLSEISQFLKEKQYMIFAAPDFQNMLEKNIYQ
ncbi:hypothetical protein B0P06_003388 [Clostridium saccharoperbutylacetonicum]|uniref:Methyltransferase domain-containing protein n=1 Tax=Clostridium saccharoperbutylacetonicum N1-4(HMT) TaxID=931276 RepID=M1N4D7_9CLOT|nr:hypothetical protein [Clostridium saccharoperbutylacetonicum]AGF58297.1 hypothetical protein Cspa_c45440 [Clostridium saccharoperbutylacetonicum N1-4(HMT)]NRT60926.1 hypothetical protein [Clostridium saccharoperbutylacetonicum]NSB24239.1 hypothetical protein [Clostridium saccharoperbutylacetonicum]NSB43617.1 hypothetical protein [Clostridium saccharoperbutylacetonicum]